VAVVLVAAVPAAVGRKCFWFLVFGFLVFEIIYSFENGEI